MPVAPVTNIRYDHDKQDTLCINDCHQKSESMARPESKLQVPRLSGLGHLALPTLQNAYRLLSIPDICQGRHGRRPCKFFLAGVNFYRFNAKNWHFWQILRKKVAFFTDLTRKIGVFGCKFYSHKNCVSVKKMTIIRYACYIMQYHAIPWNINNCWRSVPLPCGQYNGHF